MEDIHASIAAVSRKEEAVEQALSAHGSYLGLSLGGTASPADGEREGVRKELLMHLQALREEKKQLREEKAHERDDKAKEKAHERDDKAHEMEKEAKLLDERTKERALEREKELILLRLEVQPSAAPRSRAPHNPDAEVEEGKAGRDRKGGRKRRRSTSGRKGGDGGRAASHRLPLPGSGACASAFGMEGVYGKVMELVGKGEYAFVATVCKEWRGYYIVEHAATTSQASVVASIERVYWARRHGYELTVETFRAAAQYGDVSMCKALHHMGCPWDEEVCESASRNERHSVRVLKWLRSEDSADAKEGKCPWNVEVCRGAARRGDLQLLEWLLSDDVNAPFDEYIWLCAIHYGHISALAWLLNSPKVRAELEGAEVGSSWRSGASSAASESQLDTLRWLHANASELCDWTFRVCQCAVEFSKSLEMLQWLRSEEVGCPWDKHACPEFIKTMHGTLCLTWDMDENVFEEIKQWVHANGHPCDCED